jgi:hypothetical protein
VDLALYGTAAALIAVAFQFADAGTGWHDLRRAHSGGLRLNPAAWTVPLAAVAAVGVLVGIARVSELLTLGEPLQAIVVGLELAVVITGVWLAVTRGVLRRSPDLYARLRDDLRKLDPDAKLSRADLDALRARLVAADRARPSSRVTVRRLVLGRPYRLLPPVVAAASLVLCIVAGDGLAIVENAALLLIAGVFVIVGARIAVAARLAWRAVADDERSEVVRMLEDAERRSAKRIEGLGDRVTRALQILREQQG